MSKYGDGNLGFFDPSALIGGVTSVATGFMNMKVADTNKKALEQQILAEQRIALTGAQASQRTQQVVVLSIVGIGAAIIAGLFLHSALQRKG